MSDAVFPHQGPALELDPSLATRAGLAARFREFGRVHFPSVLSDESASRLHRALREETPWLLAFNKGAEHFDGENLTDEERNRFAIGAWSRAHDGFQYFYDRYRIAAGGKLAQFAAFIEGAAFLDSVRELTGLAIASADAEARFYRPGDLFTINDGQRGDAKRLAYYVLSLTAGWRAEWGGIVQFYDGNGDIAEGFVPAFNSLMLFRVPALHSVTQVATFGGYRYTVEGWLKSV